ncbi:fimbria/pilus outer membrane usher protein [Stenotrophomonas maltophilia]|uniref:fimbria/pilus outer membrane usher protein n=1 Tax=Stenotrophomonas maltophilia TaxID=40324 RepID=UPI0015598A94|nr:fimbria/pilus outer membrane usher protein [Stenotrophomonas maltophilia]
MTPLAANADVLEVPQQPAFDADMLRARGIDPKLANQLRDRARFVTGRQRVALIVNGQRRGMVSVDFGVKGDPCLDETLLNSAGVLVPRRAASDSDSLTICHDVERVYPGASVESDPQELSLSLVVPAEALRKQERDLSSFSRGGTAAILNYEVLALKSHYADAHANFVTANSELGFNAGDWIVRSRNTFTSFNGDARNVQLDAYAQRTFSERQAVLQVGRINLLNPILSGAPITGFQVMTERALATQNHGGARIEGVALGQARIEVRQDGVLVHSAIVPAGPFHIENIRRLNSKSDLDVLVLEEDGSTRKFTVPAALAGVDLPVPGYTFAAGRIRDVAQFGSNSVDSWVATAGWTGSLGGQMSLSSGVTLATDYLAAGGGLGWMPWVNSQLMISSQHSQSRRPSSERGVQVDVTFSQRLSDRWSLNAGLTRRTAGYRDLLESYRQDLGGEQIHRHRGQYSIGGGWQTLRHGTFGVSLVEGIAFDNSRTSRGHFSWGGRVGIASLSISAEWTLAGRSELERRSVYASLSIPLGSRRRIRAMTRMADERQRASITVNEAINDQLSYSAGVEKDDRTGSTGLYGGVSMIPKYTQLDLGYRRWGSEQASYSAGVRGAAVWHGSGITFSPYPVQDTFAIASVGDVAGAKIATPSGPVWTDFRGLAVVPLMVPYAINSVEVVSSSLPRNVDLDNALQTVGIARGAVENLRFKVTRTRRLLLTVDAGGDPLPVGAMVVRSDGQMVTLVQSSGDIFLPSVESGEQFQVNLPDGRWCALEFELPVKMKVDAFYESQAAMCRLQ